MIDTTTSLRTPALTPASCRFLVAVVKNSLAGPCSGDGPVVTSMTTSTPASAAARPSPVITSTPFERDIRTTSCPPPRSTSTTCRPTRPVAPATAILAMSYLPRRLNRHPVDGSRRAECDAIAHHEDHERRNRTESEPHRGRAHPGRTGPGHRAAAGGDRAAQVPPSHRDALRDPGPGHRLPAAGGPGGGRHPR